MPTTVPLDVWRPLDVNPGPDTILTGGIAEVLDADERDVEAAQFALVNRTGADASIWVFRVAGWTSNDLRETWSSASNECGPQPEELVLAGRSSLLTHRQWTAQCAPQYLVELDSETLAVITDDGGTNGSPVPSLPPAYRPLSEIDALVTWLLTTLESVPLEHGHSPAPQ